MLVEDFGGGVNPKSQGTAPFQEQAENIITQMGGILQSQMEFGVGPETAKMIEDTQKMMLSNAVMQQSLLGVGVAGVEAEDSDSGSDSDQRTKKRSRTLQLRDRNEGLAFRGSDLNKIQPMLSKDTPKFSGQAKEIAYPRKPDYKTLPSIKKSPLKLKDKISAQDNNLMQSKLLLEVSQLKTLSKNTNIDERTKQMIFDAEKNILGLIKDNKSKAQPTAQ